MLNSIGILLYTFFFGRFVGRDSFNNDYYEFFSRFSLIPFRKCWKGKRWVLFAKTRSLYQVTINPLDLAKSYEPDASTSLSRANRVDISSKIIANYAGNYYEDDLSEMDDQQQPSIKPDIKPRPLYEATEKDAATRYQAPFGTSGMCDTQWLEWLYYQSSTAPPSSAFYTYKSHNLYQYNSSDIRSSQAPENKIPNRNANINVDYIKSIDEPFQRWN